MCSSDLAVAKKEAEDKEVARLAADAKSILASEKLALRLKLEKEAEAKWDAEIAAAKLAEINGSASDKDSVMKKKEVGSKSDAKIASAKSSFPSVTEDEAGTIALATRGSKTKKTAVVATATAAVALPITSDMDIFDLIMKASLETEKAGKADQVRSNSDAIV